jgi:hypothetical protein
MSRINLGKPVKSLDIVEMSAPSESAEEMTYPSLYLSNREGMDEIPDVGTEGEATIRFRVVSKTNSDGPNGKSSSVDLEVMEIEFGEMIESDDEDEIERGLRESEEEDEEES